MTPPRLFRLPAVRALLAQLVALLPTAALAVALDTFGRGPTLLEAAVLLGAMAMLITWRIGLAPWWRIIQLLFPVALLAALALRLPPLLFLAVFVVLLGWYWESAETCAWQNRFYAACIRAHADRLSAFATFHPVASS